MAGVAVGRNPHLKVGNDRHPLLIWPLLLGRTGSGRKGAATSTAEVFFRAALDGEYPTWAVSGLSSGEGLIERLRDGDGDKDKGISDKRLIVTETEFGTVMSRAARDGSTLAEVCRQAWNGEALSVLNRKHLFASWSHVAVTGHVTPRDFRRRLTSTDLAAGTYNRYLPLYVERSKRLAIPKGADQKEVSDHAAKLRKAVGKARLQTRVKLGAEAEAMWCAELYDEFTAADDEELAWAEFTRRAAPYCLRIAALYGVLDGRAEISKADLTAAAALVRYSIASARYVLGDLLRDPRMDRLVREITAAGQTGLTRSQVSALFGRNLPAAQLGELLDELVSGGAYEVIEIASGGRPAQAYRRRRAPS